MSAPTATPDRTGAEAGTWSVATLRGLVISEVRKTLSVKAWWALLGSAALICLLVTFVPAKVAGSSFASAFTASLAQSVALSTFGAKFAVIFGLVLATTEFRHRTLASSYLTSPGRPQLLAAKVIVAAVAGALYGLVCAITGLLGLLLGGGPEAIGDDMGPVLQVSAAAVLLYALWAIFGVGIGTLIGNQLAAVLAVLIYLLLVEQIVVGLVGLAGTERLGDYLPGGAAGGVLSGLTLPSSFGGADIGGGTMPWWLELLIFVGYTAVAVLAGAAVAQRRDVN